MSALANLELDKCFNDRLDIQRYRLDAPMLMLIIAFINDIVNKYLSQALTRRLRDHCVASAISRATRGCRNLWMEYKFFSSSLLERNIFRLVHYANADEVPSSCETRYLCRQGSTVPGVNMYFMSSTARNNTVLNATPIATANVKTRVDCKIMCLKSKSCWSVNYRPSVTASDRTCELLSANEYQNASSISTRIGWIHYSVEVRQYFVSSSLQLLFTYCPEGLLHRRLSKVSSWFV